MLRAKCRDDLQLLQWIGAGNFSQDLWIIWWRVCGIAFPTGPGALRLRLSSRDSRWIFLIARFRWAVCDWCTLWCKYALLIQGLSVPLIWSCQRGDILGKLFMLIWDRDDNTMKLIRSSDYWYSVSFCECSFLLPGTYVFYMLVAIIAPDYHRGAEKFLVSICGRQTKGWPSFVPRLSVSSTTQFRSSNTNTWSSTLALWPRIIM